MPQRPDITRFKQYRPYLRQEFQHQREQNAKYSLIYFSTKIGHSGSYLKLVLSGKRELSLDAAALLGKALKLSPGDRAFLINLVIRETATAPELRAHVANNLESLQRDRLTYEPREKLGSIFQNSLVWEIYSLAGVQGFKADPSWILPRLRLRVKSARLVEGALRQLGEMGALEATEGKVRAKNVVIQDGFSVAKAYTVALQRALEHLQQFPHDNSAHFDSFCLILSDAEFEQIREILEEAKTKAGKVAAKHDEPKSRIAYFNTNLFWASAKL